MRAADVWDRAMTFDEYVAQMTQNRERYQENFEATEITQQDRERFGGQPLRFLVLTEDFCGDSAQFVPPLGKLAHELDNVDIRVLLRDQHHELAENYRRADGYQAIPVIIMLDEDGNELGYLVERPNRVNEQMAAETRRFAQENSHLDGIRRNYDRMPEETRQIVKQHNLTWRWTQQAEWTRILFEDLGEMLDQARVKRAA